MKEQTEKPETPCTVIHNHEASGMWIGVMIVAAFGCMAVMAVASEWRKVELEKIRAQQNIQFVKEASNVGR